MTRTSARERQQKIVDEFGESFERVIRGFRADGCSWNTIAGALEMPAVTLRKWAKAMGLLDKRRNLEQRRTPLDDRARKLGYADATDMVRNWRMQGKTRLDIATALKCHPGSLYWHTPEEVKGLNRLTERQRQARKKNAEKLNRRRADVTSLRQIMQARGYVFRAGQWVPAPKETR